MTDRTDSLALDDVVRERLRVLMTEQSSIAAGQVVLLGLDMVRERLGAAWPKYADRVRDQMQKTLERVLDKNEVFLRLAEDRYVIVFRDRMPIAARLLCEKVVQSVSEQFLGVPELEGLTADSVVMMLEPEVMARSLGLSELLFKPNGDLDPTFEMKPGVRLVTEGASSLGEMGEVVYIPGWDIRRGTVYTYKPTQMALRGRRRVSGYYVLDDSRDDRAVQQLDFACLEAVSKLKIETDAHIIINLPVSLRTLNNREAAVDYFARLGDMPPSLRTHVIFEFSDMNPGSPVWRIYEILVTLNKFSRGVVVRVDRTWQDLEILRELPIRGLVFDLEMDPRSLSRISEDLQRFGTKAAQRGWLYAVSGVHNRDLVIATRQAGARLIYGHYLVRAVSKPMPPATLDWMMIRQLGPGDEPLTLEPLFRA